MVVNIQSSIKCGNNCLELQFCISPRQADGCSEKSRDDVVYQLQLEPQPLVSIDAMFAYAIITRIECSTAIPPVPSPACASPQLTVPQDVLPPSKKSESLLSDDSIIHCASSEEQYLDCIGCVTKERIRSRRTNVIKKTNGERFTLTSDLPAASFNAKMTQGSIKAADLGSTKAVVCFLHFQTGKISHSAFE